jgi:hypothetical protein
MGFIATVFAVVFGILLIPLILWGFLALLWLIPVGLVIWVVVENIEWLADAYGLVARLVVIAALVLAVLYALRFALPIVWERLPDDQKLRLTKWKSILGERMGTLEIVCDRGLEGIAQGLSVLGRGFLLMATLLFALISAKISQVVLLGFLLVPAFGDALWTNGTQYLVYGGSLVLICWWIWRTWLSSRMR